MAESVLILGDVDDPDYELDLGEVTVIPPVGGVFRLERIPNRGGGQGLVARVETIARTGPANDLRVLIVLLLVKWDPRNRPELR